MKFYYTTTAGSSELNYERQEPERSLGGYRSVTPVPNGSMNSLFGDLSQYTLNKKKDEYIALVLKNETGVDVTDINVWFDFPIDSYTKFQIAAVDLAPDADGNLRMENLPNINAKPYYATFVEAEGDTNKQNIGDLLADGEVGIWFKRSIFQENIDLDNEDFIYKENIGDRLYKQKELNGEDEITINIEWS